MKKLVFLPTGPLSVYQDNGYEGIYDYYNPMHYFDEVICVSPYEEKYTFVQGIQIIQARSFQEYQKVILEINPSVIRAYGAFYSSDYANYYRINNIPVITSVHDVVQISPSVRYADKVICMSEIVREKIVSIGADIKNVVVMPNRVDTTLFNKKNAIQTEKARSQFPEGKMILCVARRCEQKNTDNVIKALKYLSQEYFCVFVGMGNEIYKRMAEEEGVGERCFWIDSVRNRELPLWYSMADCFCLPSRWEGFGIVFLEAAACELPIVTSNIAPMNEYLNKSNAWMIDEYLNPEKIAEVIQLACTAEEAKEKVQNAKLMVRQFERTAVDKREAEIYRQVIETPKERKFIDTVISEADIVVWGAGCQGKIINDYMTQKGKEVKYFVDNSIEKQDNLWDGKKVISPNELKDELVIVPNNYYQDVYEQVKDRKIRLLDFNFIKAMHKEL